MWGAARLLRAFKDGDKEGDQLQQKFGFGDNGGHCMVIRM